MPYLVLTDGTTTVDFAVTGNYPLKAGGYIPNISSVILDEAVQERGLHYSVTDEIRCEVKGSSAANAFANLHTLKTLLLQAKRWYNGERNLAPVVLKYSPDGATVSSSGNPLNMVVYGPVEERDVVLASKIEEVNYNFVFSEVVIRLRRQGEMLGPKPTTGSGTTERITSGPATENTVVKDLTFTGTAPLGRYPVAYHVLFSGAGAGMGGLILLARKNGANNNIVVGAAGGLGPGAPFSDFNDASNDPKQGTNVLRFTPTGTTAQVTPTITNCSQFQRATVIINFRNNNSTTYKVRARFNPATSSAQIVYSPYETIDAVNTQCRFLVMAPTGLLPGVAYGITLELTASAASGTLDINYVAVINEGDPYTQAIVLENGGRNVVIRSPLISDDLDVLALSAPSNALTDTLETAPNTAWVPTLSAVRALFGFGNTMQVLVCMNEGGSLWHPNNGGAVAQIEHRLFRRLTYLTPQ